MRFSFNFQTVALSALALTVASAQVRAQGIGLSVSNSPNPVIVGNSLTYTIDLTNQTGVLLTNVFLTNTFSAPFQFVGVSGSPGTYSSSSNTVSFDLAQFTNATSGQLILTIQPMATGFLTNTIVAASDTVTNVVSTNVVTQVLAINTVVADLAVTMTGPASTVFVGDYMTCGVQVTNLGPGTVSGVFLTNALPPGVMLLGISPSNELHQIISSNVIFNVGTLTNGGFDNFALMVEPTNAGTFLFTAIVSTNGVFDPNIANNSAGTNIIVTNYFAGQLVAVTNSPQVINWANSLIEQTIVVSNAGLNAVDSARVVVSGLTNRLFNAVGTNNGNPFVVYATTLNPNQSVSLLLQYDVPTRSPFPFTNSQLAAFPVSVPNLTPPPVIATSTNFNIYRILKLSNGSILLEFPATSGRTYTVVYSDNVLFSNARIAPPSITAFANEWQWVDYGPPTTVSHPTNAPMRFYRVYLNP